MNKFGLFGKFTTKEADRDRLVAILLEAAESMKDLEECEVYIVSASEDEPNAVYVYEVWADESTHQASLTLESTQTLIKHAKPIITGMERICTLEPKGGKGISSHS
ncbi:putative quinol monooxygenase [Gracilibacillus alcaliphilus]|uniref:putative quinol monooxygenase n=1 Tax=Gracilibacillus alcaliphilus TaxID=1401441 RepID=UPI00195CF4A7|nr:putative quinol monooxygenase [Gracilibacillus alcaliphilus]MBM7675781.1 quinol monooxygenase YgiN [Gracilibacillus alcaliphilus]